MALPFATSFIYSLTFLLTSFPLFLTQLQTDLRWYKVQKSFTFDSSTYMDNDYYYLLPLCLGTSPQCFEVLYETNFTSLAINPIIKQDDDTAHHFNRRDSSTFFQDKYNFYFFDFTGGAVRDCFMFEWNEFPFDWIYAYKSPRQYHQFDGVLGLGSAYTSVNPVSESEWSEYIFDKKYSVVEMWYFLKVINKRMFGHKYMNNRKYMRWFFGEIHDEDFVLNSYPKCYLRESRDKLKKISLDLAKVFSCMWSSIDVMVDENDKNTFINIPQWNSPVIFSTGSNDITGPREVGERLLNIINSINNNCRKVDYLANHIRMICSSKVDVFQLPKIKFNIDGVELTLLPQNLFYKEVSLDTETFVYRARVDFIPGVKYWTFGQSVLREYDMVFNMEDGSVGFWNWNESKFNVKKILTIFGWGIAFAVICFVIVFGWIRVVQKRRERMTGNVERLMYNKVEKLTDLGELHE